VEGCWRLLAASASGVLPRNIHQKLPVESVCFINVIVSTKNLNNSAVSCKMESQPQTSPVHYISTVVCDKQDHFFCKYNPKI